MNFNIFFDKVIKELRVISAFVNEHEMEVEDVFLDKEKTPYCKKCNLPMAKMEEVMAFICWGCQNCLLASTYITIK